MVEFSWDEDKRLATLVKHGLDFVDAIKIFAGPTVKAVSSRDDEERWIAIGLVNGLEIAVVYTMRGKTVRVITARRARRNERKTYYENFPV